MAGFDEIKQAFGLDTARTEEFVPDPNHDALTTQEQIAAQQYQPNAQDLADIRRDKLSQILEQQKFAGQHRDYAIGSIKAKLQNKVQVSKQEALERLSTAKDNKGKTAEQPVIPLMEFPPVKSIQRNNPFNVEKGDDWQGLVESDSDRFMAADTPLNGLRAGYINMLAKFKEGKTVRQTIEALSPALDNNPTEKMIAEAVRMSGASADSVIALDDYSTIKKIGQALLKFEAPGHTYSNELLDEAVDLAIEQKSTNTVGTGDIPQPNLATFAEDFLGDGDSETGTGLLAEDTRPVKQAVLQDTTTIKNLIEVPNPGDPNAIPPTPTIPEVVERIENTPTDIDVRPITPFITPDAPNEFNSVSEGIANLSNNEELSRTLSTIPQNSELAEALASVTAHSLHNDSPVIGQYGKYAFQHEDGSWTIRQENGETLTGLDEISAKSYNNYHQADLAGIAKGASTDEFTQAFNRVIGSFAAITEIGAAFVGDTTLNERVDAYNYPKDSLMLIGNESRNITPSEVTSFQNIQTKLRAGKDLTAAQETFIASDKYNTIAELDIKAADSRQDLAYFDEKAEIWRNRFPVNKKDLAGAMTVVQLLGANEGLTAALKQMILVDPGTFAKIGYDSVGYSMMLTAGGAVPRAAMFIALARSNAVHAIEEFKKREGRDPTAKEVLRIEIAAGVEVGAELISAGVVVKTFGRLVPGGKFAHTNDVVQAARKSTPDGILKLTIFNPVKGVAGSAASEGVSGGISSAAHRFGQGQDFDATATGIDAALEAIAMPSSVAGIIGVDIGVKATAAALDTILNPSFKERTRESVAAHLQAVEDDLNSTVPVKVGQLAESEKKVEELTKIEAVLSVLDKDIDGNFNPENADTENEAFNKYYADFFEDGMLPAAAEAAARKRIRSEQAGFGARKAELVAELSAEASGDQVATHYANLEKQRDALKETFEDGDFSKKAFKKKLKGVVKPAPAGTPIKDVEFNKILKDANTTGLEKAVGVIAELSQRVVSVSQKAKLLVENNKLIQKLKGKGAELVDKAVDQVTFFGSVGPTDADITKALANPDNTEVDNQVLKAQQRANEIARQIEEAGDNKTLEQVAADISDGAVDSKFTGIKSYQDEILSILNSDDIEKDLADKRIANLEERMSIFTENLRLKSEAFKKAQAIVSNPRNKDKAVQVVSVSDKERGKRAVRYEIITGPITEAQSQYATVIHKNSARLIDAVSREAAHAASVLTVTTKAKNTTFVQKAAQTKAEAAKAAEQLAVLQAVEGNIKTEQDLYTTDDIETIKDPAAGAGKAKPGQPSDTKERTKLVNRIKSLTAKLAEQTPGTAAYQETFTDLEIMNDALARLSQETAATSDPAPKKQAPSTGSTNESSKGDGDTGRTGPATKKATKVPSDKSEQKKDEDVDSIKIGSKVQATIDGNDIFKTFATVLQIYPEEKGEIGVLLKDNSTGEQSVGLLRNLALVAKTTTPKKSGNPSAAEIQAAVDLAGIESAKASVEADQLRDVFSSTSVGVRQIFSIFDPKQLLSQIARMESILTNAQEYPADRIAQARLNLAALKIQHAYISSGGPELGYSSPEQHRHLVVQINKLKKELLKLTKSTKPHKRKAKELNDAENALKVLIDKDAEIAADLAPTHSTTPFGESDPKSPSVLAPTTSTQDKGIRHKLESAVTKAKGALAAATAALNKVKARLAKSPKHAPKFAFTKDEQFALSDPEHGFSPEDIQRLTQRLIDDPKFAAEALANFTADKKAHAAFEFNQEETDALVGVGYDESGIVDFARADGTASIEDSIEDIESDMFTGTGTPPSKFTFSRGDEIALFRSGSDFLETGQGEEAFDADLQRLLDDPAFADKVLTELRAFVAQEISNAEKAYQEAIADGDTDFGIEDAENINEESGTDEAAAVAVLEKLLASRTGPASTEDIKFDADAVKAIAALKRMQELRQNSEVGINEDGGVTTKIVAALERLQASRSAQPGPNTAGQKALSNAVAVVNKATKALAAAKTALTEEIESFEAIDLGETGEEGVESNEEIRARLEGVQENESERTADNVTAETENFIEANLENFPETASETQASVTEKALGIEGKKFSDLVKIAQDKDGNDLPGILDIPTSAFLTSDDPSTTALENALIARGLTESAAVIMAEGYVNFAKRYTAIILDEEFKNGIFAGKKPLALLHIDGKLPPQIIFAMSVGITQFVQRTPSNVVFRSDYQKRNFLYTNDDEISDVESAELDTLGHGYQDSVDEVGKNIASYLHLAAVDARTSGYLDNLIVALGLAAIQIEHGPTRQSTDESHKDAALRKQDNYHNSRLHVELHKWELDGDTNKEGRKFNKNVTQEEADALNAIRNELIKNTKKPKSSEYSNRKKYAAAEIAYKKKIGERVKISVQQFKHIKLHTPIETRVDIEGKESKVEVPIKITDAEAAALVATGRAFDVDTRDQYPLQEASKDVVKTIRNSLGNVPEEVERVLKILQNTPWTKAQSLDALVVLLKIPGMRPVIEKMIGVVPVNPLAHEADQISDTASNKNKLDALNEVLDAYDAGKLDKFFFTFRLQNQLRILMQGKVNPQNSKVTRALLTPSVPPLNYTADNIHLFKQAVAYNLGIKIDKQDLEASEAAFHTIVNNPNIQRIVAILADLGKLSDNPELGKELVELLPSIQVTPGLGGDMSIMQGLMALTHYMPDGIPPKGEFTGSFSSDVIFEIDGISNGFFMNVMQFPQFGEDNELRRQQVGLQRGEFNEELHHDTSLDGVYIDLVGKVREGADPDIAADHSFDPESFNREEYKLKSDTLNELYAPLTDEDSRDLVKYPFIMFMYGAGIPSISTGVGKLIVQKMYRKLSEHIIEYQQILNPKLSAEYVRDKFTPFAEQMDILEAFVGKKNNPKLFKNKEDFIASFRNGEAQKKYFNDNNLIASIGDTLAPRFDYGLNGMLGGTGPARQAVIQAGEIMYAVFKVHFDKVYALELKKTKRDSLSKKEITELIERKLETEGLPDSLLDVFPQYRGPLISETERAFIDLTKTALIDEISAEQVSRFAYKNDIGKQSEAASAPRRSEFIRPGVSALIRLIINMDSAILTKVLGENPTALMLHDAFIANPEILEKISKSYGKWSLILNNETSVLESIHAQTRKVLNLTQKLDKRDIGKIDTWLQKNAHINRFPDKEAGPKNLRTLMEEIATATEENREARAEQISLTSDAGREESMQMFLAKRDNRPKNKRKAKAKAKKDKTPPVETSVPFTRGEPTAETELKKIVYKTVKQKHTSKDNGTIKLANRKESVIPSVNIGDLAVHKADKQNPKSGEDPAGKGSKYEISHLPSGRFLPLFPHQRNDKGNSTLSKSEAIRLAYSLVDVLEQAGVGISTIIDSDQTRRLVGQAWAAVATEGNPDEAISEFLTKNQAYKGTEENKQDTEREMGSLDDLPRDKPKTTFVKDIGASNVDALFKQFAGFSNNYYQSPAEMAEHTGVLSRILSSLSKGMDETTQIELLIENIDGITQGRYDPARDAIRLSLSRQAPGSANGQSPQEVYVHELLHAMISAALKDKPLIGRRIELLYNQVKRDMDAHSLPGYTVFLDGIANPTADDVIAAKRQYNYLFDNPKKEANKLHEFLAYAVTNKSMIKYLSGKKIELPVRNKTLLGQLQHIVDLVVDQFRALINRKYLKTEGKANAFEEMVAVVEHLTAVQSKHQSLLAKYTARTYDALSESDQKIRDFLNKQTEKLITANPSNALQQFASDFATVGVITMSDHASMHHARQVAGLQLNKTLRSIANEVGGGSLTPSMIERLLHAKVNISKARQEEERFTIKWFNGIWKSVNAADPHAMTVDVREALTDVLLRADISSLRTVGMSANAIMDTLGDRRKIDKEQKAILSRLNLKVTDKAIQYAAELGFHIASGDNYYSGAHMNAMSIAHTNFLKPTEENIALLDAYASLEAMIHLNPNKVQLVKTLSNNEFAEDGAQNGIIDMMDSHLLFKQKSRRDIFKKNPGQMVKGFIVERVDDLTSVLTGTKADAADMEKAGYTESYPLSTLTNTPGAHDTLYVSRKIPEVPDASGVMSMTNQRNMGTTLTEIFSKDPAFQDADGNPDFTAIRTEINKFDKIQKQKAKVFKKEKDLRVRPLRDQKFVITDYRVMINHENMKHLLRPDMEVQNVFAHMHSGYIDRKNTIDSDKAVVDLLVHEQSDMAKSHKNKFIDFLKDPAYVDRLRKLPREVREYMESFAVNGSFLVREDIVDKVFGYKVWDFSQFKFLQTKSMGRIKRYAGVFHYTLRQIVGYGKDRIVVAMPKVVFGNMASNIYQLSMRNIPLSFTIEKIFEGISEYNKYQTDSDKLKEVTHAIESKNLPASSTEAKDAIRLQARLEANKIHKMSKAGLNSLIVEDVNMATSDGYFNRIHNSLKRDKRFQALAASTPKTLGTVATTMFMTKTSVPYQLSRKAVQLTDFLGRYVMIEHATKVKNQDFNTAMHEALTAFVLFDETLTPALEALDALGATSFISYFLRNQRAARRLVQTNPTGVGVAAAVQYATGIQTLGNVNSAWLTGDVFPNVLQLDDLFDEANNVTGLDLIRDAIDALFGN